MATKLNYPSYLGNIKTSIKVSLRDKCIVGWTGDSKDSDIGLMRGLNVAGSVQSSIKKMGNNAFSYTGGNNSAIEFRLNETLKANVPYTISCWCRWNDFNYAGPWGMWGDTAGSWDAVPGIAIACQNTGQSPSYINLFGYNGVVGQAIPGAGSLSTLLVNNWYHITCEIGRTYFKLYLDGVFQRLSPEFSDTLDLWTDAQIFRLGGYALTSSNTQLNGYLDQFCVFRGVLNQEEISWLYNSGNGNSLD